MFLVDLSHTSHCQSHTGIQRVCRCLHDELKALGEVRGLTYDPFLGDWRELAAEEQVLAGRLANHRPGRKRGARWSAGQKVRGHARGLGLPLGPPRLGQREGAQALFVPEVFTPRVAAAYPSLFERLPGVPRIAVFHDAVALRLPEISPKATVERMPAYLDELRQFDGIAANSHASAEELKAYWAELGVREHPPVEAIVLACDFERRESPPADHAARRVLVVGTIEGRKNHLAMLQAFEALWSRGLEFSVQLAGGHNRETGAEAVALIETLKASGRPLQWEGPLSDEELVDAFHRASFTVYASLYEGFGLPVLESLSFGRPCVCTPFGALKESAEGGGTHLLDAGEPTAIAEGVARLLEEGDYHARLCEQARERSFRAWSAYAREMVAFAERLRKHL